MDALLTLVESELVAQRSLVTREQLRHVGITRRTLQRLLEQGVLKTARPGVFALVGTADTWERGLLAVVLSVEGAVASHSSAARLWAFAPRPEERYECTIDRTAFPSRLGVKIHRVNTVHVDDITAVLDIPCTNFERTLCDCTALLSPQQLGRALDDGLRRNVASLRRLEDCAERLESARGRKMSIIRGLLSQRVAGHDPGGSRSELDLLDVFREARLPLPVQQHWVSAGGNRYRLDYAWPAYRVFAEWYGFPWHVGVSAVAGDSERITALAAAGWLPLIFTEESKAGQIVRATQAALEQRGVGRKTSA